jgi:hypothetical protein
MLRILHCLDSRLIDGGKVVSLTHQPHFTPHAYDSLRREVLYNILIQFGVPMKLVRLIKMCLNETYSKVCIGRHVYDKFPIQNDLKQGDA